MVQVFLNLAQTF